MHRSTIVLCSLLILGGGAICQAVQARTQCEATVPGTHPTADKSDKADTAASQDSAADAKPAHGDDATVTTGGGSAPASGGGEDAGNLAGSATSGGRKHGLRWQSLLPGVIK